MTATTNSNKATARIPLRDEIIAVALVAVGLLFLLSLISYNPNDASWNTASRIETHNLVGAFGASLADALLQSFGLAAYPLPLLLFFAAWRLFHAESVKTRLVSIGGWTLILIAVCGLLNIAILNPIVDRSFFPGGLTGAFVVALLSYGVATVGASIILLTLLAVGVLVATPVSFASILHRFDLSNISSLNALRGRLSSWQAQRNDDARARSEQRQAVRTSREAARMSGSERVEAFMRDTAQGAKKSATQTSLQTDSPSVVPQVIKRDAASAATLRASVDVFGDNPLRTEAVDRALSNSDAPYASNDFTAPAIIKTDTASDAIFNASAGASLAANEDVLNEEPRLVDSDIATFSKVQTPLSTRAARPADANMVREMMSEAGVVRVDMNDAVHDEVSADASAKPPLPVISNAPYELPQTDFLVPAAPRREQADDELLALATQLGEKCQEFNVTGKIEHICPGPVVTTYEFKPSAGVKYSRITGLVDDLCLALKAESIRIDRLPGKAHVGIEVPNATRETIYLREVIESRAFQESSSKLTLALGKTIDGLNYVADLAKMPHLLIAGATGTGKSVCLNSLVVSILYKASPDEVKFIMVDPKRLELGLYADIPHLATPIITEPKRAANALKWAVRQMEERYKTLARYGVRNLEGYNAEIKRRMDAGELDENNKAYKPLPLLVILIDELADLMMVSGHEVEEAITRLAQMARAVGIHLILATQRPSVDVITGLIKANFPSRISFRVSSKVDSRTILDANGSEGLLGRGDMLFLPPGTSRLVRVHGAYLDETEVNKIVDHIKAQSAPVYDETITQSDEEANDDGTGISSEHDELFDQALRICTEMKRASTSVLQRRLRIGYGRAAAILDVMEREGLIGPTDGARPRLVLGKAYETVSRWDSFDENQGDET